MIALEITHVYVHALVICFVLDSYFNDFVCIEFVYVIIEKCEILICGYFDRAVVIRNRTCYYLAYCIIVFMYCNL